MQSVQHLSLARAVSPVQQDQHGAVVAVGQLELRVEQRLAHHRRLLVEPPGLELPGVSPTCVLVLHILGARNFRIVVQRTAS